MLDDYSEITNYSARALVRKARTHNGARLEVYSQQAGSRVLLDALLLESLSWQSPKELAEGLDSPHERSAEQPEEEPQNADSDYTGISNEFAAVLVRVAGEGEEARLEIQSPKLGYKIYLAAPLLETLSWQTPEKLSEGLEEPYGPAGAAH